MPGVDPTDFFNYQLTPDTWKDYCAVVHKFRNEFSMQKRINTFAGHAPPPPVFVDPELPPELRAAVAAQRMGGMPGTPGGFAVRNAEKSVYCGVWVRSRRPFTHNVPLFLPSTTCRAVRRSTHMRRSRVSKVRNGRKAEKRGD
jgi:hypothetical protein